ncbi:MAG: methyltransferase [Paludibacteraceae bacterium]|nr:methyltransferase [Paludibacteraceae bacterium]MBN2788193.1 methyltransferase [Paludibacteraceae bacterium]
MFQFKQFTVYQEHCAMKVGTDGVLLGAWTDCENAQRILDIGTGTGLLALMLAQRCSAHIVGIDIDQSAVNQAKENIAKSAWKNRITIFHCSFQDFCTTEKNSYDCIISNPPYFENALKSPLEKRTIARHTDKLKLTEILEGSKKLLSKHGSLNLILPYKEGLLLIEEAKEWGFYCRKKTTVFPRENSTAKRILLNFKLEDGLCKESDLTIETDKRHQYTEAYKKLTGDFYLKF